MVNSSSQQRVQIQPSFTKNKEAQKYRDAFETVLGDYDSYPECGYIDELAGLIAGYYSDKDYETLFNALANESVNRGEYELVSEEEDE